MQTAAVGKANGIAMLKPKQHRLHGAVYHQTVRVMKLTSIILLATCLHVWGKGNSQTVTLSEQNAPLEKVFRAIEQQTDFVFFADFSMLQKAKAVTIRVKGIDLKEALDICFKEQPLSYSIVGKNIIISLKNNGPAKQQDALQTMALINVKGRVVNENSDPVAGVTVTIKGRNISTSTNANGEFILSSVEPDAILVFTHVSMEVYELKVGGKKDLQIRMRAKVSGLDEVQVVAYGTTTRRLSTGNVSSVKASDIEKQPVNNPLLALQGRVPGLIVTQVNGMSGGAINVQIQGKNSIEKGNDPLYVIDGVPYPSHLLGTGIARSSLGSPEAAGTFVEGNPMFYINPADIESIDVLKDADATAIYGSRAANGAILITTKRGKAGQAKCDFNIQQGWGKVPNKMDMMNTQQYVQMRQEALAADGITPTVGNARDLVAWDTTRYTDWQKELIGGTAHYTNIHTSVSGGTSAVQYLVGGTYHRETTVFPTDFASKTGALHLNLTSTSKNQRFHLQISGNYTYNKNELPYVDVTQTAVQLAPNAPALYNTDGSLNWGLTPSGTYIFNNPLAALLYRVYTNKTNNLVSNAVVGYNILPGLDIKSSFGYTNMQTTEFVPIPLISQRPDLRGTSFQSQSYFGARNMNSWIIEPQASFKHNFGKGVLEILMGATFQQNKNSSQYLIGSGYSSDLLLQNLQAAPSVQTVTFLSSIFKYNAFFGRINYNWQDKYLINLSARRDGSSRFGGKNKFHDFGSIGTAWIFSKERFIQSNMRFLSFGKLKASYGTTGNDRFADYVFLSAYMPTSAGVPYQGTRGLYTYQIANPYIQWEETHKLMTGMSLGFLNDRIVLDATYSRNRSSNQILPWVLPSITGFTDITYYNFPATVQNTSWEFACNATIVKNKDFIWSLNGNLTIPRNKLLSFPNIEETPYALGDAGVIIGQPLGIQKIFHYTGVDPSTGLYTVADENGNPTTTPNFATGYSNMIATLPKFYGGLQNSFAYKGFQLDFLFQFVKQIGQDYYAYWNGNNAPGRFNTVALSNQPAAVYDNHWVKTGDNAAVQKYSTSFSFPPLSIYTDAGFSDAPSFIRLKNIALSWNLPTLWQQKMHLQNARIYVQGQNLFTITRFKGLDPEMGSSFALPALRVITVGVQFGL